MDLEVVMKSHDCPFIVNCIGSYISKVSDKKMLHELATVASFLTQLVFVFFFFSEVFSG